MRIFEHRKEKDEAERNFLLFLCVVAAVALGQTLGLGGSIASNFFRDSYDVTAFVRGMIEFPREIPGILCIVVVAYLSSRSDIFIAMVAQILCGVSVIFLGLFTPSFGVMLAFLAMYSFGMHMFFPLQESIGLKISGNNSTAGATMGRVKSIALICTMLASIAIYLGFKGGFFTFKTPVKWVFLVSAGFYAIALILLFFLQRRVSKMRKRPREKKRKFVFKRKYAKFYILATLSGAQKQMMTVFGTWVMVSILTKGADYMAILVFLGSFIGIYFTPFVGRWTDKFGIKKILFLDAFTYIIVYLAYGFVTWGFVSGRLIKGGIPLILMSSIFVADAMSTQIGMVRTVYLNGILDKKEDLTPTLALGISFDHILAIICAFGGGYIWAQFGAQWIFFIAASMSVGNLLVASSIKQTVKRGADG
ncbi:MAG: MFS transporter [Clostridiales bacterium]|jgi:MFS family permease|nr:MFS transporter [Clostridiales bacterium]